MKIRIKTELIEIEIEDEPTISRDGYMKRDVPKIETCIKTAIEESIRLHSFALNKKEEQG